MKKILLIIPLFFVFCGQNGNTQETPKEEVIQTVKNVLLLINPRGNTIKNRFNPPEGFERISANHNSFAKYLQNLPLKPHGSNVFYYNGSVKPNTVHEAVINMDVGNRNLQQCADAVMRLRGEFLFAKEQYEKIYFNFTNGFRVDYSKWVQGYRIKIKGNKTWWIKSAQFSNSYNVFRKYMNIIFAYSGTLSLEKELIPVDYKKLQIGDIFIQGGSPGHAVIIVDMAINKSTDEKIFMLAQSYMPAQDIHILKNWGDSKNSPWYKLNVDDIIISTPEWEFKTTSLKRFK